VCVCEERGGGEATPGFAPLLTLDKLEGYLGCQGLQTLQQCSYKLKGR